MKVIYKNGRVAYKVPGHLGELEFGRPFLIQQDGTVCRRAYAPTDGVMNWWSGLFLSPTGERLKGVVAGGFIEGAGPGVPIL